MAYIDIQCKTGYNNQISIKLDGDWLVYGFSIEEFNTMVEELEEGGRFSGTTLYYIAERVLRPIVNRWCRYKPELSGEGVADDLMQEIHVKLFKNCVSGFLRRDGLDAPINDDYDGFERWMVKVAVNATKDFCRRQRKCSFNERFFEEGEEEAITDYSEECPEMSEKRILLLRQAFSIVLGSDAQVYKVLTWVAEFLFILKLDKTRIDSNEEIIDRFASKTLFEMRDMLFDTSNEVEWLRVTDKQREKIECALQRKWDEERVVGQVEYSEFYMKKGAKATISDWVNRMNNVIKRVIENEALND